MKPRTFTLRNDTWGFEVAVRIGGTEEDASKWATRVVGTDIGAPAANAGGFVVTADGSKAFLMWLSRPLHPDVIAHESLHIVSHVMSVSGMGKMNRHTDEAYAYLLGWIVREIWRKR